MFDVNYSYKEALQQGDKNYDGLMLFALELSKQPTRTEISDLTRTFNRISQKMPVALVLKYKTGDEAYFSIAISERFKYKQNWRQGEKAGKVIILRDIHTVTTHAGHERILLDLVKPVGVTNYDQLHQHWLQVLDVNILNKKFFQDLANWYFWAMDNVSFPDDLEKKKEVRNATNLIRLITRVVFIWFIKEKGLVDPKLFEEDFLKDRINDFNKNKSAHNYYNAILQNLFFGTLNQKMDERKFAKDGGSIKTNGEEYGVKNLFRYADLFTISEKEAMQLFKDVPFLNGGLFDCLDKPDEAGKIVYVDGFSRNPKKQAVVPDYIFFGEEREVDLNDIFATKNKKYKSRGLIDLLESYKFTVAENTPIEEEIALDPELLGKVFENLLASYNPETQTTARKQTGSFYTPREIVNYMVDESLLEYIKQNVKNNDSDFETRLRDLISYAETPNPFDEAETKALIEAINNVKILDPACGSGAYPMGILHKMVHLLQQLDPDNKYWMALQRQKAMEETEAAFKIGDKEERGKRLAEINDVFENNASDYGRKLYLIENCIYGIDIQPIAVQISKLRFFISLIIDQNKQASKENFGIRSLPNLETKFVAANTLIGLDKPAQTLLRNPDIEVKENQLKELRHKYFTANTRKEKLQYQKQDKKLRHDIAKMLESDGWQTAVAKQIVAFDPYDQNQSSGWFDTEWMFGLTSGFDIVIGNPPYGITFNKNEIEYFRKRFKVVVGHSEAYYLFVEIGAKLLKHNALLAYIIPNAWFSNKYAKGLRKWLLEEATILNILNFNKQSIFENAGVETSVIILKNCKTRKYDAIVGNSIEKIEQYHFNYEEWVNNPNYNISFSQNPIVNKLLTRIQENSIPLGELLDVVSGYKPYQIGYGKNLIGKPLNENDVKNRIYHNSKKINKNYKPELRGKDIEKYRIRGHENYILWGDWLMSPKEIKYFENEKILFRKIIADTFIATIDISNYYIDQSLYVAIKYPNTKVDLKYFLGLLNSKLLGFFFKKYYSEDDALFPQIKVNELREIPFKIGKEESKVSKVVSYIMYCSDKSISHQTFFERLNDAIVYELYLPEEINAGGAEVLKHLGNLPELKEGQDEKNLKTIEKVYKELSDPKHPISAALLKLLTIEEINIIEGRK